MHHKHQSLRVVEEEKPLTVSQTIDVNAPRRKREQLLDLLFLIFFVIISLVLVLVYACPTLLNDGTKEFIKGAILFVLLSVVLFIGIKKKFN